MNSGTSAFRHSRDLPSVKRPPPSSLPSPLRGGGKGGGGGRFTERGTLEFLKALVALSNFPPEQVGVA